MQRFSSEDYGFMAEALALGESRLGQTGTNPSVGCLIVRAGKVVGQGITAPGGRPHAETSALLEAGELARGATVYVSLEPCSHFGETPPCAVALMAAGVGRVVAAMLDPNPLVAGKGMAMLAEACISAEHGLMADEAKRCHAGHINRVTKGLPEIFLKMAVSADGYIGRPGAGKVAISCPQSREFAHRLRSVANVVAVGIGTVLADDPQLTCRTEGLEGLSPVRAVFDRRCRTPAGSTLATAAGATRTLVMVAPGHDDANAANLRDRGVEVIEIADDGAFLANAARRICELGFNRLMVEGGSGIAAELRRLELLDTVYLISSPEKLGAGVPALDGMALDALITDPYVVLDRDRLGIDELQIAWRKDWV